MTSKHEKFKATRRSELKKYNPERLRLALEPKLGDWMRWCKDGDDPTTMTLQSKDATLDECDYTVDVNGRAMEISAHQWELCAWLPGAYNSIYKNLTTSADQ